MDFSTEELNMLLVALDKKLWSMTHIGLSDSDPRKAVYRTLRTRIEKERTSRVIPPADQS